MIIQGHLHRIDDLQAFSLDYLGTNGNPTQGFSDWGPARVFCAIRVTSQFPTIEFLPSTSIRTDADDQGSFRLNIPDLFRPHSAYLVVFTQVGTVPNPAIPGRDIPIFAPIYRSASFDLDQTTQDERGIFIFPDTTPNDEGFTQSQVSDQADQLRTDLNLDSIRARIKSTDVDVRAEQEGAIIRFDIKLRPSTSDNLDRFIVAKVDNLDIDLPGIDFITGLCVDREDVERRIRNGVRALNRNFNELVLDRIPAFARDITTVTIRDIRFPVTQTIEVPNPIPGGVPGTFTIRNRSIVGDPCVGFPRQLFP